MARDIPGICAVAAVMRSMPPMTSSRQFALHELIYEMRLLVIGRESWLERARKGEISRPREEIERKAVSLGRMKAIGNLLVELQKKQTGALAKISEEEHRLGLEEYDGQNKNNKA